MYKSVDTLINRIIDLGLGNKTFMASYYLYFRTQDYSNVILCGLPMSVFYHEDWLCMCHSMLEQFGLEVRVMGFKSAGLIFIFKCNYSSGSDSVNILRILSIHTDYENKVAQYRPLWVNVSTWEDILRRVFPFLTIAVVDVTLVCE